MAALQEDSKLGPLARYEQGVVDRITDFNDSGQEWRRLFSELLGTLLLASGGRWRGHDGSRFPNTIGRSAAAMSPHRSRRRFNGVRSGDFTAGALWRCRRQRRHPR
jgi:hypothetical protein